MPWTACVLRATCRRFGKKPSAPWKAWLVRSSLIHSHKGGFPADPEHAEVIPDRFGRWKASARSIAGRVLEVFRCSAAPTNHHVYRIAIWGKEVPGIREALIKNLQA